MQLQGLKISSQMKGDEMKMQTAQHAEGMRMAIDAAKSKDQMDLQTKQAALNHMSNFRPQKPKEEKKPK